MKYKATLGKIPRFFKYLLQMYSENKRFRAKILLNKNGEYTPIPGISETYYIKLYDNILEPANLLIKTIKRLFVNFFIRTKFFDVQNLPPQVINQGILPFFIFKKHLCDPQMKIDDTSLLTKFYTIYEFHPDNINILSRYSYNI